MLKRTVNITGTSFMVPPHIRVTDIEGLAPTQWSQKDRTVSVVDPEEARNRLTVHYERTRPIQHVAYRLL